MSPEFLLRLAFLNCLVQTAESYSASLTPTLINAAKQLTQGFAGSAASEFVDNGLSGVIFKRFYQDTRNWHLWVLSFHNPTEFLVRLVQYSAVEILGVSFGHLAKYSLGVAISGIRSQIIKESATLASPKVIQVLNISVIIRWSVFGIGVTGVSIFALLAIFQRSERQRYMKYEDSQNIIDVSYQSIDIDKYSTLPY